MENRIKEGKNTLRWGKPSCYHFVVNGQVAHVSLGLQPPPHAPAILPGGEEVKRSTESSSSVWSRSERESRITAGWHANVPSGFPWLDFTAPCWGDEQSERALDAVAESAVRSKERDQGFLFITMTTVFACVRLRGTRHGDLFWGQWAGLSESQVCQNGQNGKTGS